MHGPLAVQADEVELKFATLLSREELLVMKESANEYDKKRTTFQLIQLDELGAIPNTYSYPVQVTQFGDDLTIITLASGVVVDYSLRLKLEFGGESPSGWLVTVTMSSAHSVVPPEPIHLCPLFCRCLPRSRLY